MRSWLIDPDEARREAREILSGAEYSEPQEGLVERAVGWLFDRLGDAIGTLTGGGPGSVIGWLVVVGLVGGAAWLLVRALRVPHVHAAGPAPGLRYGTESHFDPLVWMDESARLAAAGDHRGAIRCRYQALLARLVVDGVVDDVAGRTAGEYRAVLASRLPQQADAVEGVTDAFEQAWYGGVPVGGHDLDRVAGLCERIETAATTPLPSAVGPT